MENETPKWLRNIQNNSWEPEILISGLTITFLFLLNDHIYNFFGMLIQEYNVNIVGKSGYWFSIGSLNTIILVLIVYLLLRGLWVGLIGLSFVYPNGVQHENLPKEMKHLEFEKPESIVIKCERICSLLFSYIFTIIITLVFVFVLYAPIILIEVLFMDKMVILFSMIFYFILFFTPIVLLSTKYKKTKTGIKYSRHFFNNIVYTITTNAGNKLTSFLFILLFVFAVPLSLGDFDRFDFDNRSAIDIQDSTYSTIHFEHYENRRDPDLRIQKVMLESMNATNYLDIFISHYQEDVATLSFAKENDSLYQSITGNQGLIPNKITDLITIFIDSTEVKNLDWFYADYGESKQSGLRARIDLNDTPLGPHILKVNKVLWSARKKNFKLVKNWDRVVFYRI